MLNRVIHLGDPHIDYNPEKNIKVRKSLDQLLEDVKNNPTDVLFIPGDLWDRRQKEPYFNSINNEGLGVKTAKEYLTELSKYVKAILITKGNNHHDDKGSIEMMHQLTPNIYGYEYPVMLAAYEEDEELNFVDLLRAAPDLIEEMREAKDQPVGIFTMIPYPTKEMLVSNKSIDQSNQEFNALFDGLMQVIGILNDKFTCPKFMGIHANVLGSRLSNGQNLLGQDIIISPVTLRKANCDYYALNHIHLYQEIEYNMRYAGGFYNMNWGEIEPKYFIELQLAEGKITAINPILLKAVRPMVEVKASIQEGKFIYDHNLPGNAEVRFKFDIPENETSLLSEEMINEVKSVCGEDVRIDKNIIPAQRESRSEAIMDAKTLTDEFVEFMHVIKEPVTETMKKKVALIEIDTEEF